MFTYHIFVTQHPHVGKLHPHAWLPMFMSPLLFPLLFPFPEPKFIIPVIVPIKGTIICISIAVSVETTLIKVLVSIPATSCTYCNHHRCYKKRLQIKYSASFLFCKRFVSPLKTHSKLVCS